MVLEKGLTKQVANGAKYKKNDTTQGSHEWKLGNDIRSWMTYRRIMCKRRKKLIDKGELVGFIYGPGREVLKPTKR